MGPHTVVKSPKVLRECPELMYEARYLSYCAKSINKNRLIKSNQQSLHSALKEVDDTDFEGFIHALETQHEIWRLLHEMVWFAASARVPGVFFFSQPCSMTSQIPQNDAAKRELDDWELRKETLDRQHRQQDARNLHQGMPRMLFWHGAGAQSHVGTPCA